MYRSGPQLACPACGGRLEPLEAPLLVHACAACGGAMFGAEAASHILRGHAGEVALGLVDAMARASERAASPPAVEPGPRACPMCGMTMAGFDAVGIHIDSCPAHGTWFDRDEATKIVEACREERGRASGPPPLRAADVVSGTVRVLGWSVGTARILLETLFRALER